MKAYAIAFVALLGACRSYSHVPVTPWLTEVSWVNETIIAESGRGRGTYLELTDEKGNTTRIEGWGCVSLDAGRAALCQGKGRSAFVVRRVGAPVALPCEESRFGDGAKAYPRIQKIDDETVACVEARYDPVYLLIVTRMDLSGRVLERSEKPMETEKK